MKARYHLLAFCAAAAIPALAGAAPASPVTASAKIEAKSDSKLAGTATFTQVADHVHIVLDVTEAPAGVHAVHIHEKGDCSAPDASSAGGHFNPTHAAHGAPDAAIHHAGDFGNMTVGNDGHGHLEIDSTMLTVAPGDNSVVGRAIVVHGKADDMVSQPAGNAGPRIGCGVIH